MAYDGGSGVDRDNEKSLAFFKEAAREDDSSEENLGSREAQCFLGNHYCNLCQYEKAFFLLLLLFADPCFLGQSILSAEKKR